MSEDCTSVILAGGLGTRMRPLTDHLPKSLLAINDRPIIEHLLAQLSKQGVTKHLVLVGHLGELIERWCHGLDGRYGQVHPIFTAPDVNTVQRVLTARDAELLKGELLLCYADGLADIDLDRLRQLHARSAADLTLTVTPLPCQYGVVDLDHNTAIRFRQKPTMQNVLVNIGYMVFDAAITSTWAETDDLETSVLPAMAAGRRLAAYTHNGYWRSVDAVRDFDLAVLDASRGVGPWLRTN